MKTGTTYLQRLLEASRADLAAQGVLFPGRTWNDQHLGVREILFDSDDPEVNAKTAGRWDALVKEVHDHPGRASVISMEYLSYVEEERARKVLDAFEDFEVHVILGVRDAERGLPAQWHTAVTNGSRLTLQKLVRGARHVRHGTHSPTGRGSRLFQRTQGIPRMLGTWTPLVGPERMHVLTVPAGGSDPAVLWERFADIIDVQPEQASPPTSVANASLGHCSTELVRRINVALGPVPPVDYWQVVRDRFAYGTLRARSEQEQPIRLHRPGVRLAREWNGVVRDAVTELGVHVSGTLEDLPVGPVDPSLPTRLYSPTPDDLLAAAGTAYDGLLDLRAELGEGAGEPPPPRDAHGDWEAAADPVEAAVAEILAQLRECIDLRQRLPSS
jgi:hypothetical protein